MNCMLGSPNASGGLGIHGALKSGLRVGLGAACVMASGLPAGKKVGKRTGHKLLSTHDVANPCEVTFTHADPRLLQQSPAKLPTHILSHLRYLSCCCSCCCPAALCGLLHQHGPLMCFARCCSNSHSLSRAHCGVSVYVDKLYIAC
jgi:hypothetical protein